ncbi:hypothetical protein niasHT_039866 [Heterodera trifolii]|uniref:Uncharacterized protein n=1 Tax=Heterodera trifolii TaxID=157864 RepID=A0ABD2IMV3_9BILA
MLSNAQLSDDELDLSILWESEKAPTIDELTTKNESEDKKQKTTEKESNGAKMHNAFQNVTVKQETNNYLEMAKTDDGTKHSEMKRDLLWTANFFTQSGAENEAKDMARKCQPQQRSQSLVQGTVLRMLNSWPNSNAVDTAMIGIEISLIPFKKFVAKMGKVCYSSQTNI